MKIQKFTFNGFQENTYVVSDSTGNCLIIDPGCETSSEQQELVKYIENNQLKPTILLNTHCHIDHILGNQFIADKYQLALSANPLEKPVLAVSPVWGRQYGIYCEGSPEITHELTEGVTVSLGENNFEILFVPGHSPGHIALVNHQYKVIFGGDVLFRGGYGRVDLPGGNYDDLQHSIINKLFVLPDDYLVYAGHGNETTIGFEKLNNPILNY